MTAQVSHPWTVKVLDQLVVRVRPCTVFDDKRVASCDFEVFEIVYRERMEDGSDGPPMFTKTGANDNMDATSDMDGSTSLLHGFVKFDSCAHFDITEPMMHVCGPAHWEQINEAITAMWAMAREMMQGDEW